MNEFGLQPRVIEQIRAVLRELPGVEEARVYGSRAMGNYKHNSDIDLALWGEIDPHLLGRVRAALDELPLPYTFDITDAATVTSAELRRHIEEEGKPLYKRGAAA